MKTLAEVKAALSKESSKVLKLEAEVAELMKQLAAAAEVQREVEQYRRCVLRVQSQL